MTFGAFEQTYVFRHRLVIFNRVEENSIFWTHFGCSHYYVVFRSGSERFCVVCGDAVYAVFLKKVSAAVFAVKDFLVEDGARRGVGGRWAVTLIDCTIINGQEQYSLFLFPGEAVDVAEIEAVMAEKDARAGLHDDHSGYWSGYDAYFNHYALSEMVDAEETEGWLDAMADAQAMRLAVYQ